MKFWALAYSTICGTVGGTRTRKILVLSQTRMPIPSQRHNSTHLVWNFQLSFGKFAVSADGSEWGSRNHIWGLWFLCSAVELTRHVIQFMCLNTIYYCMLLHIQNLLIWQRFLLYIDLEHWNQHDSFAYTAALLPELLPTSCWRGRLESHQRHAVPVSMTCC